MLTHTSVKEENSLRISTPEKSFNFLEKYAFAVLVGGHLPGTEI